MNLILIYYLNGWNWKCCDCKMFGWSCIFFRSMKLIMTVRLGQHWKYCRIFYIHFCNIRTFDTGSRIPYCIKWQHLVIMRLFYVDENLGQTNKKFTIIGFISTSRSFWGMSKTLYHALIIFSMMYVRLSVDLSTYSCSFVVK